MATLVVHRPWSALTRLPGAIAAWPVTSQQVARRNAMLAATECGRRRAEREAVADLLAATAAPATDAVRHAHG